MNTQRAINTQMPFKTATCEEYDFLLHRCKAFFDECRETSQEPILNPRKEAQKKETVEKLLEQYEKSYAKLIYHFDHCRVCQLSHTGRRRTPRFNS